MDRQTLLSYLSTDLYEKSITNSYKRIADIVQENIRLILDTDDNQTTRFITFKGEYYFNKILPHYRDRTQAIHATGIINKQIKLDSSLYTKLDNEVEKLNQIKHRQLTGIHYIRAALNMSRTVADLKLLLPNELLATLQIAPPPPGMTLQISLTPEEVEAFKLKYQDSAAEINEQLLLNLLLKKT